MKVTLCSKVWGNTSKRNLLKLQMVQNFAPRVVLRILGKQSDALNLTSRCLWTQPYRTSAWWDNFVNEVEVAEEWRENFQMSRRNLLKLSELLRPHIEDVTKRVACTLYYLSNEGHLRKTANGFGLSCQVVSKIIRDVCRAMTTKPLQQLTMIESSSLHLKLITSGLTVMKLEANELEPCSPDAMKIRRGAMTRFTRKKNKIFKAVAENKGTEILRTKLKELT
ncbi:hypothetical protein P5673_015027 [Acropora cervicornis]|uniref:Uncharacterized protein n=1 Tax=Acropora cervicornis TaxID=6130 RepID=A0AAD9QHZ4_ACRCE|nr:hypothetical protein P5673_015027 [Acropora cervicornis]